RLFPYTTLFRSRAGPAVLGRVAATGTRCGRGGRGWCGRSGSGCGVTTAARSGRTACGASGAGVSWSLTPLPGASCCSEGGRGDRYGAVTCTFTMKKAHSKTSSQNPADLLPCGLLREAFFLRTGELSSPSLRAVSQDHAARPAASRRDSKNTTTPRRTEEHGAFTIALDPREVFERMDTSKSRRCPRSRWRCCPGGSAVQRLRHAKDVSAHTTEDILLGPGGVLLTDVDIERMRALIN